ncbi:MAG: class A beta-lactamase [Rhodoblastus sp.]|nr:class A beta-lactamase [Rhodoblastus sp.]MCC2101385.1 class A beta-lactamase [Hyphomicrobiales bacterium]
MRDTGSGARFAFRAEERFPLTSTFKFLAAAAVLAKVDAGKDTLHRRVVYAKSDLVTYSPETEKHAGEGMALGAICEAAITLSDNTAGNLMLAAIGGPEGLTRFARKLGDEVTRLDRIETALNEASPGDPRDTTSPSAMLGNLEKLLLGDALETASRERLTAWLIANKTGDTRLRAGLPAGWRVGDKTGAGGNGTANDLAIVWPPGRKPILIAAYLTQCDRGMDARNQALAEVARILTAH